MVRILNFILLFILILVSNIGGQIPIDQWSYKEIDSTRQKWGNFDTPRWLSYIGFDAKDVTGDDYLDIVSGRYFYRNPSGDVLSKWDRIDLGMNVDGMLFVDIDGDEFGDIIAQALPKVYWFEASDTEGTSWEAHHIADLPTTFHINSQGYDVAQIVKGGKPEILFTTEEGAYYINIPDEPGTTVWDTVRITSKTVDEGVGIGDIDGDGHLDIVVSTVIAVKKSYTISWYKNPGDGSRNWKGILVNSDLVEPDRIVLADLNGDN